MSKQVLPLGTLIDKKDILNRRLHVGDVVICMPSHTSTNVSGFGIIAGQTPKHVRVYEIRKDILLGILKIEEHYAHYTLDYAIRLHAGQLFKVTDPAFVNSNWALYITTEIRKQE